MKTCPKCEGTRWKTVVKNKHYQCRKCGYITNQTLKPSSLGLVSIIIPTHAGRNLDQVLGAIAKSEYRNVEVVVVSEGKERSAQRNIGIDRAKGQYLLFLDSDMVITPTLIGNCLGLIHYCHGIYIPEIIKTKGLFGRVRNWERQFYTGTAVDAVRFVRADKCPRFDEGMSGPEDSDWDRRIEHKMVLKTDCFYHYEDIGFIGYLKKKSYYCNSMNTFKQKHPNDKILNWKWRCFGVFFEEGKWKRVIKRPDLMIAVWSMILIRGLIYTWKTRS